MVGMTVALKGSKSKNKHVETVSILCKNILYKEKLVVFIKSQAEAWVHVIALHERRPV